MREPRASDADRGIPWRSLALGALAGLVLVALAVAFVTAGGGDNGGSGGDEGSAPAVTFTRFDGTTGSVADYRGRPLVVNFFASWCVPCAREMPDFAAVDAELGGRVAFLGIANQDRQADAEDLAQRTGVTYDLAGDVSGAVIRAFGGVAMPTTVFVSAEGDVLDVHSGPISGDDLRRRIDELLLS